MQDADALLVDGRDPMYLCYWMRASRLADLLPSLNTIWIERSAGSMVMTPRITAEFVGWAPHDGGDDTTLGFVDVAIFPYFDNASLPWNTMVNAEKWAARISDLAYAIDDETASNVVNGVTDIVREGKRKPVA